MYKVLLVTDDWDNKKPLKSGLLEQGFTVTVVGSAQLLREDHALSERLNVIVADLERCATDTTKLVHVLRRERAFKDLPLVLLVPEQRLAHIDFSLGIEDYLTLPLSAHRLAQRLRFLMWKLNRVELKNGFSCEGLIIDFERYEVRVKGQPIDLTYKEFELLKFLVMHPGKPFTREVLLDKVWGYDFYGGTRTVDVHIRRLRAKIEPAAAALSRR